MSEHDRTGGDGVDVGGVGPTAEESWQRHLRILDLLKEIRETRRAKGTAEAPGRPR